MAVSNGPSAEDYEAAGRLVRIGEDMDERDRIRLLTHVPIVVEGRMRCSCGARFVAPTMEQRATDFLEHRRHPDEMGENIEWPPEALGTVPDDAPPPVTVTVWTMPSGYAAMESVAFEAVESWGWKDGVFTLVQSDGTETSYPAHNVHHTTTREA